MSKQIQSYLEDMKKMYEVIKQKTSLTLNDKLFLITYKKTIDNSISIPFVLGDL